VINVAIGEEIFQKECWMAYMDDGKLSPVGKMFMEAQRLSEWNSNGAEHPCYGCRKDDCKIRQVNYHDDLKRYMVKPKVLM
jgi:hypothetical protein